jgi:hypothetical protein
MSFHEAGITPAGSGNFNLYNLTLKMFGTEETQTGEEKEDLH